MVPMRWPAILMISSARPAEPDVAVLVDVRRVAGEVDVRESSPSSRGRSAPARPTGRRQPGNGRLMHEDALLVRAAGLALGRDDGGLDARAAAIAGRAGLDRQQPRPYGLPKIGPPVSVCHMWSITGMRSSKTSFWSHSHAGGLSTSPAQNDALERLVIDARERLVTVAHQQADGGGRGEDAGDAVLDDLRQLASACGWSSAPSKATVVQPASSGA